MEHICHCDSSWNKIRKYNSQAWWERIHSIQKHWMKEWSILYVCAFQPCSKMSWTGCFEKKKKINKSLTVSQDFMKSGWGLTQCYRDGKIRVKAHLSIYLQSWNDLRRTGPQAIILKFNKQKQRYIVFLYVYWLSHHLFHSMHVKIFYRDISLNKEQKLFKKIFREKAKQACTSINENDWSGWSSREVSILLI